MTITPDQLAAAEAIDVKRYDQWVACADHPPHGLSVLTYRDDRGYPLIGWWDKECCGWIVYDANGTRRDEPDIWRTLPKPTDWTFVADFVLRRDAAREQAEQLREAANLYREAAMTYKRYITPIVQAHSASIDRADALIAKADAIMKGETK